MPNNPSRLSNNAGRYWLITLGLGLAGAGLVFTWVLWTAFQRANVTRGWSPIPALVVRSTVHSERPSPNANLTHHIDIAYEYEVDGISHTGTRVKRVDIPSSHLERIEKRVQTYPVGTELLCYVDPEDPTQAVLQHTTRAALYSIWFPLLFVFGGLGMAIRAWQRPADQAVSTSP